jgi:hypothetical protein
MWFYTVSGNLEKFSNAIPCSGENCRNTLDKINNNLNQKDKLQNTVNELHGNIISKNLSNIEPNDKNEKRIIKLSKEIDRIKSDLDEQKIFDKVIKYNNDYNNLPSQNIESIKASLKMLIYDLNRYNIDIKQELIIRKKIRELSLILDELLIDVHNSKLIYERKKNCKCCNINTHNGIYNFRNKYNEIYY